MTLRDGDTLDAATLQAELDAVRAAINDVPASAVRKEGFRRNHLPELYNSATLFPNGLTAGYALNTAWEAYDNFHSGDFVVVGTVVDWQEIDTLGPNAPYGPSGAWDGWVILAYNNVTANAAEVVLKSGGFDLDDEGLWGIFCHGTVEIGDFEGGTSSPYSRLLAIGFEDSQGNRHIIEDSVAITSRWAATMGPRSVGWVLRQADLDEYGDGTVEKVFLAYANGELRTTQTRTGVNTDIGSYWLSLMPLRAGDLD